MLLRPSWPEDAKELHQAIADEGIIRNLASTPWSYAAEDAVRFAEQDHDEVYPAFLLMLRTMGAPRLVGGCGLGNFEGNVELGYWIARPYWGLGFATEASRAVINIAKTIGHTKLVATHFTDNPASGKVLRKLGFQNTGQIATRASKGRGEAMSCAKFEKTLEDAGSDRIAIKHTPTLSIRAHFERLQAA